MDNESYHEVIWGREALCGKPFLEHKRGRYFLTIFVSWTQMKFNIATYIILAFLKNVSDKIL